MTATPQPAWSPPRDDGHLGAGRIAALVVGLLLLLPGLTLVTGGGVLLWADSTRNTDGYLISSSESFRSEGSALVSERIELDGADWLPFSAALGTAQVEVTAIDPDTEVFVGLAPVDAASAYLDGVGRTVIDDLGTDEPVAGQDLPGGPAPGPPGGESFWVEQAAGAGPQELVWEPAEGDWMLVVMNADGAAGVSVDARIGATVPALTGLAWALLVPGVLVTAVGVLIAVLALRRRGTPAGPTGTWAAPGTPPAWTPPSPRSGTDVADRPAAGSSSGPVSASPARPSPSGNRNDPAG